MKIKRNLFFYSFLILGITIVSGQRQIDGNLIRLSELTLDKSPLIQRNKLLIDQAEANFRNQRSLFDYELSSGINYNKNRLTLFDADPRSLVLSENLETNSTEVSLALQKRFRTGLIANISTDYSRISDNFPFNSFNEQVGANISNHASSATFSLTQPLLRGNGLKITTAFEKSAALAIESAKENFELNSAFELLQMGNAYWQYLGAFKSLEIFKGNEDRVRNVLNITEELVKADKRPASELFQIKADLAEQERQTAVAEQNLYNARLNLGRVIGISEGDSKRISDPLDDFPTISASQFNTKLRVEEMIALAQQYRTDIKAIEKTQDGLELQLKAAKNTVLPQLDLTGFLSYGGVATGGGLEQFFNALGNRPGRNRIAGVSLTFSLPVNNNSAKANLASSKIAISDQQITYDNLIRNIDLNVSVAHNNLDNSVVILEKAEQTLGYYQEVFKNEQVKFQNGLTTLLNLILFQERLTFAHLEYVRAQQLFAVALINLRFETGTLISMDENKIANTLTRQIFYTLPNNN